jgi:hypothetical protein
MTIPSGTEAELDTSPESGRGRVLLVGKNSQLVGRLLPLLRRGEAVSHSSISDVDFAQYQKVYLFSWSKAAMSENESLIDCIPGERLVLISTTAVLALGVRPQWATYPKWKRLAERRVLERGGAVLRVGVTDEAVLDRSVGFVLFSSIERLASAINELLPRDCGVATVGDIRRGGGRGWRLWVQRAYWAVQRLLPSGMPSARMPLDAVMRLSRAKTYGYSGDAQSCFWPTIQVGFGVLGEAFWRNRRELSETLVIYSGKRNEKVRGDGFQGTLLGYRKRGLAELWHGVHCSPVSGMEGYVRKSVPLFVPRSKSMPRNSRAFHVDSISWDGSHWQLRSDGGREPPRLLMCRNLVLSAGPLENCRLLANWLGAEFHLDDHEARFLGVCRLDDAVTSGLVRKLGPLVQRSYAMELAAGDIEVLVDVRPYAQDRFQAFSGSEIYVRSLVGIVAALLRSGSLGRINEAFYNKFGWAFGAKVMAVHVQALAKGSIQVGPHPFGGLSATRSRLAESDWEHVCAAVSSRLASFDRARMSASVDAQHACGGGTKWRSDEVREHVSSGRLVVVGAPGDFKLSARHHTKDVMREMLQNAQ